MNEQKKTLVIGASTKEERYSNICIRTLLAHHIPVVAVGLCEGDVGEVEIKTGRPQFDDIHTVTLYIGPQNQPLFYDYVRSLKPSRVIFNPGTENPEFEQILVEAGIQTEQACTIVMANTGMF